MLSRSSSAYQPLAQAAVGETVTPAVPRRNFSGHNAAIRVKTKEDRDANDEENHEVGLSIVINYPFGKKTSLLVI